MMFMRIIIAPNKINFNSDVANKVAESTFFESSRFQRFILLSYHNFLIQAGSNLNKVEIRKISLPSKNIRIGRPKGSGRTVVGTKKKSAKNGTSAKSCDRITRSKTQKRQAKEQPKSQPKRTKV